MKTENTLDTIKREFLEMYRTEMQALSFKTSNVLYYGKEGPYLLTSCTANSPANIRCFEIVTHAEMKANPQKRAAAFSDADFILKAIHTMDLSAAELIYDTFLLSFGKMTLPSYNKTEQPSMVCSRPEMVLRITRESYPADAGQNSGVAVREKATLHQALFAQPDLMA